MSWSVSKVVGTPAKVKEYVGTQLDSAQKNYPGKPEGEDIAKVKSAIEAFCDEAAGAGTPCVYVECNGSRSASWLTIKVEAGTINLLP